MYVKMSENGKVNRFLMKLIIKILNRWFITETTRSIDGRVRTFQWTTALERELGIKSSGIKED